MAITQLIERNGTEQDNEGLTNEYKELVCSLPKERGWRTQNLYLYQGFWCQPNEIQATMSAQKHFQAHDSDLMVVSVPKSGTTWLKALTFAIMNREKYDVAKSHPLHFSNPHELVPFLEYKLYADNKIPDLSHIPRPRLLATHIPLGSLPGSIRSSKCKMVYICRNPFDTFVSAWHFINKIRPASYGPLGIEDAFNMYCRGVVGFGPYWDHMLGYWYESLTKPDKVLFLKYEDMKENPDYYIKKLALFLGWPFTLQEEKTGVVQEIGNLCSFKNLRDLEVNKKGKGAIADFENKNLFRKADVGDWVNHFTPMMVQRLAHIMEEKLSGSGLSFKVV
ncbi:transferase [Lithospermum erythrorhizon]|uniref:Sulfotransferase n=1 Tax=Lithospermum erythrorhizon TaxID=34254 RepID=A0AAV3QW93_LITER